jgi:hypothetical protein
MMCGMAMPRRIPITDEQLTGWKYFRRFLPLLDRPHDAATARDSAHNRTLHYDPYLAPQLIFFFNPIVTSMRGLVRAGALKKVRQQLGAPGSGRPHRRAVSPRPAEYSTPICSSRSSRNWGCNFNRSNTTNAWTICPASCWRWTARSFRFIGWADADELEAHIAKLKKLDA